MAKWQVEYGTWMNWDLHSPEAGIEIPCFRIYPEGEPERWIVQTNAALPRGVQEEMAYQIADALFNLLGV
jgi:hypothetical protein